MQFVCPECKNDVNLPNQEDLVIGKIVECNTCGITLEVISVENEKVYSEVVEEGK